MASAAPSAELATLERMLDSWIGFVEDRRRHRDSREFLSALDDKHLFVRGELEAIAKQAGFAQAVFESFYEGFGEQRCSVMREISLDIAASLLREAGVEAPTAPLRDSEVLTQFSEFYSGPLLSAFSPQEFCLLLA
jgi:hypothetical protein